MKRSELVNEIASYFIKNDIVGKGLTKQNAYIWGNAILSICEKNRMLPPGRTSDGWDVTISRDHYWEDENE